jgi:pimeloyl-ACP methyl ester carboxylesterase
MRKNGLSKSIVLAAGGLGTVALAIWAFIFFLPLQAAEMSDRFEFWREGVSTFESAGIHGYMHDRCEGTIRTSKDCMCVGLVHGLADNAMTWKKILLWPAQGWLQPVKLFAFDLPGSGGSPVPAHPSEDYRARNQARALKAAMAPLCSKWMIVGNSMGGWVASWVALDWPEGVSRLVLLDSAGLKASTDPKELEAFTAPSVESLKDFQKRAYFKGRPLPDNVWRAAVQRMKASPAREIIQAQQPEDFLDGRISTLRRPTMLLWGEADQMIPMAQGQALKSLIPGAVWQQIPQCGHLPQKECPLDVIRAIAKMVDFGSI